MHDGRGEVDLAGRAVEAGIDAALSLDAVDLLQKVDVKVGAAELPSVMPAGRALLEANDLADAVFDVARSDLKSPSGAIPCLEQLLRGGSRRTDPREWGLRCAIGSVPRERLLYLVTQARGGAQSRRREMT
jgi:hypothetical protein